LYWRYAEEGDVNRRSGNRPGPYTEYFFASVRESVLPAISRKKVTVS
jgi:hypothetical protein